MGTENVILTENKRYYLIEYDSIKITHIQFERISSRMYILPSTNLTALQVEGIIGFYVMFQITRKCE